MTFCSDYENINAFEHAIIRDVRMRLAYLADQAEDSLDQLLNSERSIPLTGCEIRDRTANYIFFQRQANPDKAHLVSNRQILREYDWQRARYGRSVQLPMVV